VKLDTVQINEQDPRRKSLKEGFIANRGWWAPFWDDFLALDVEMFEAFLEYGSVAWKKGHLAPKVKEFIYCAIDCSTTHMYEPGLRIHLRNAFKFGATPEEMMEVYELVASMGIHTVSMAAPILMEELRAAGQEVGRTLSTDQQALKDQYVAAHCHWSPDLEDFLLLDIELFQANLRFSSVPLKKAFIEPKIQAFILLAVDAATTHLHEPGVRKHIRNAIRLGATRNEIMEVLELVSILGMHTISWGVPVLVDELRAQPA
jgi:alkylhydroperoxidase/carboxymuconolactone decarboxylase family protein YurZ